MARYSNKTMLKKQHAEIEGKGKTHNINQIPVPTHKIKLKDMKLRHAS